MSLISTDEKIVYPIAPAKTITDLYTGHDEILYCITIYNETGEALLVSLCSIIKNIAYLYKNGKKTQAKNTTLCIIADGMDAMSESTSKYLTSLGLYNGDDYSDSNEIKIYKNKLNGNNLFSLFSNVYNSDKTDRRWFAVYDDAIDEKNKGDNSENDVELRVLLCIKNKNQGKLNSHWWFFKVLCNCLNPTYCIQMDIGTVPKSDALYHFLKYLEQNPRAGAAASQILINSLKKHGNLLHLWQYGDFAGQKIFDWPVELMFGYLTVIPGQFCIFRWSALKDDEIVVESKATPDFGKVQKLPSPLENYFRGLEKLGPFESNMFLAEDRILGFEIFSRKSCNWKLHYCPSAIAITDPCESIQELFRQRRRWINSSFTCNLWLISKIGKYLKNSSATLVEKLQATLAVPWLGLNNLFLWVLPAFVIILNKILIDGALSYTNSVIWSKTLNWLQFGFIGFIGILFFLFSLFKLNKTVEKFFYVCGFLYVSTLFGTIVCFMINGFSHINSNTFLLLLMAEYIAMLIIAIIYSRKLFLNLIKVIPQFIFYRPFMLLVLTMYSFCNLHNNSWGTKGLDQVSRLSLNSNINNTETKRLYKFYRFRFIFITMWLLSNVILVVMFYNLKSASVAFNVFLYFIVYVAGFKIIAGFLMAIKRKFQ